MSPDQHPQVVFFLIVVHKGGISVINIRNYIKDLTHTHMRKTRKFSPLLPIIRKLRALLGSLVLTSTSFLGLWVGFSTVSLPIISFWIILDRAYKIAVHHPYTHLHSSTDLRKLFLWAIGPTCSSSLPKTCFWL